ncbi:major tail tube protein [Achromobacter phage phiAxp-1]|uniref:major tail tube protein n=1 Tax=Achromobacter phage phiAxp-1 TaxID=1610509 RepID=UPI0006566D43|nr:major tail tube protein [Achromobacter phage phiAxp-1]AKJ71374.1 major tail tube protein [Achromobacter phage phiAxp-1]
MAYDCPVSKQNSNDSSLHIAEEDCLKQLPGHPDGPNPGGTPVWYEMEPNEYSDFGQEVTTVARAPLKANRSNLKGSPTDIDASGGWNMDVTKTNMSRLMQGFMFANMRELPNNTPMNDSRRVNFAVGLNTVTYDPLPSGMTPTQVLPQPGAILLMAGNSNPVNNGVFLVETSDPSTRVATMHVTTPTVAEPPNTTATARVVGLSNVGLKKGFEMTVVGNQLHMDASEQESIPGSLWWLGVRAGTWVFLGGDQAAHRMGNNVGYARVALDWNPNENPDDLDRVRFDLTTFTPENHTVGENDPVQIYLASSIANGRTADEIVRRSYTIRRGLGFDADGEQAEYLIGSVPNEFTLNVSGQSLLNADLTFVAVEYETKDGANSEMPGIIIPARSEAAYNTSSNVYAVKLYVYDKTTSKPSALFGYLEEGTITINNGVTPDKAVGVMGAFDTSQGNFTVGGELTAYFTTVAAAAAIRNNADVGLYNIFAADNAGFVADIPLLTLGGGRINVTKDEAIKIPLTLNGAQAASLETLSFSYFAQLPNIAMPK